MVIYSLNYTNIFYLLWLKAMKKQASSNDTYSENEIILTTPKQKLKNKKIYFDSDGTEIKIGYDEKTGIGFVEVITV